MIIMATPPVVFSPSRHNLGNLSSKLDRAQEAIGHYEAAIRIDDQFYPAKVNLAILHSQRGQNRVAERLLREVVDDHPEVYDAAYSLGLLLVESVMPRLCSADDSHSMIVSQP